MRGIPDQDAEDVRQDAHILLAAGRYPTLGLAMWAARVEYWRSHEKHQRRVRLARQTLPRAQAPAQEAAADLRRVPPERLASAAGYTVDEIAALAGVSRSVAHRRMYA